MHRRFRNGAPWAYALASVLLVLPLTTPASADLRREAFSAALQGDLAPIVARVAELDPESLPAGERAWWERFDARFVSRTEVPEPATDSPFAEAVIGAYRAYWTDALLGAELEAVEGELSTALAGILAAHGAPAGDEDPIDRVAAELETRGLHCLTGRTPPLLELMVWTAQDTTRYEVELTDARPEVTVCFLGNFVVKGWSHWATLGRASTGGWATKEALFCLRDDYDLDSERFRVSYLQHEGRHFADYLRYPALESADLEYRAKLTELVYADTTRLELLRMFSSQAAPVPTAPHSLANFAVVTELSRELDGATDWTEADGPALEAAARRLLDRHDEDLAAAGAETTPGIIPARYVPSDPGSGSR